MVDQKDIKDTQNVFVIGALGAGKSTIISTLYFESYEQAAADEAFKASKSLSGFT
jgi:ABC-type phosphate/phosphonate transport system ATPase subunit